MRSRWVKALTLFLPLSVLLSALLVYWMGTVSALSAQVMRLDPVLIGVERGGSHVYRVSTNNLPDEQFPALRLHLTGGATEMYLDKTLVFSYEMEQFEKGAFVGETTQFITLPSGSDFRGTPIVIRLYGDYTGVKALEYGDFEQLFRLNLLEGIPALCVGAFMLLFGIVFLMLTISFSVRASGTTSHIVSALISIDLGIWLLTSYNQAFLFASGDFFAVAEVASYFLILPLFTLMLACLYGQHDSLMAAAGFFFALWLELIIMHVGHFFNMNRMVQVYDVILLLATIAVPILYYRQRVDVYVEPSVEMQERGILLFDFFMMISLASKLTERYEGAFISLLGQQLPLIGSAAFVIAQVLNYYLNISDSYTRRQKYAELNQLAYVDVMTGLSNRKSAQNMFRMLNSAPYNYCIASVDLNGLKQVNDTYGHKAGDMLLEKTADVLNTVLSEDGFRARLGGDEFVIVLEKTDREKAEAILQRLNDVLKEYGQETFRTECGLSYGYAFKDECPDGTSDDVFALADQRMYTQKKAYHKKKLMEI